MSDVDDLRRFLRNHQGGTRARWSELARSLALVGAGGCVGARMADASVWIGLASIPLFVVWLVLTVGTPGPDDPR